MRKLILLFVLLLTAAFVNAQDVNFNLKMTVDKYIEVVSAVANPYYLGVTDHANNAESLSATEIFIDEFAYANCGFTVTVSGDNPAGQGVPRFAKLETGGVGLFDVLPTQYEMKVGTNGVFTDILQGKKDAGLMVAFSTQLTETPHDGQVSIGITPYVNVDAEATIPVRQTLINNNFGYQDSADAGLYECTLTITLTAI